MVLGDHTQIEYIILNAFEIEKSRNEALLGAILDNDLNSYQIPVQKGCSET